MPKFPTRARFACAESFVRILPAHGGGGWGWLHTAVTRGGLHCSQAKLEHVSPVDFWTNPKEIHVKATLSNARITVSSATARLAIVL